ncbi:response regulator transcription factor [Peterkaempfera griseoplana]|uniref:response regulator transcription factor n=1 Tax=Peterkaempfera griseoplana TaxID=66896 RepID=UPI0006E156B0|nr:response regulator transcription factor [Peterkaempfera griseoplana]
MIRLLLAEEVPLFRAALTRLLNAEPDIQVVGELGCLDTLVPTALRTDPDLAVIAAGRLGAPALTAVQELRLRLPSCPSLLTLSRRHIGAIRRALETEAVGLVSEEASPERFLSVVRSVAQGRTVADPELAGPLMTAVKLPLTPRELDVLTAAAEGASNAEISDQLCLSTGTVRNYLSCITRKLGARNRLEAVRIAEKAGWL